VWKQTSVKTFAHAARETAEYPSATPSLPQVPRILSPAFDRVTGYYAREKPNRQGKFHAQPSPRLQSPTTRLQSHANRTAALIID